MRKLVAIIESNEMLRDALATYLSELCNVETQVFASSAVAGQAMISGSLIPDLVLFDLFVPFGDLTGDAFVSLLRSVGVKPMILIVDDYNLPVFEVHPDIQVDFVSKPLNPKRLRRSISRLLNMNN